jgi:hypothetical protein
MFQVSGFKFQELNAMQADTSIRALGDPKSEITTYYQWIPARRPE